jgi:hypothetical protein
MLMFHATSPKNVESILKDGIKKHFGEIYLSDSVEGAARWKVVDVLSGAEIAVITVSVLKRDLRPGVDHSQMMHMIFGAGESFVTTKDISPFKIKKVDYVRFAKNEEASRVTRF